MHEITAFVAGVFGQLPSAERVFLLHTVLASVSVLAVAYGDNDGLLVLATLLVGSWMLALVAAYLAYALAWQGAVKASAAAAPPPPPAPVANAPAARPPES